MKIVNHQVFMLAPSSKLWNALNALRGILQHFACRCVHPLITPWCVAAYNMIQPPVMSRAPSQGIFKQDEPILMQSTMSKRAQGRSLMGRINWRQRTFKLQHESLSWWDENDKYKGIVKLEKVTAIEPVSDTCFKKQWTFQVDPLTYTHFFVTSLLDMCLEPCRDVELKLCES